MSICGGFTEAKEATKEIQTICDKVKVKVEEMTHKKFEAFRAVQFRSQLVAGTNFLIKVHVGGVDYIHLLVFQALPCHGGEFALSGVEEHHKKDDHLVPFNS